MHGLFCQSKALVASDLNYVYCMYSQMLETRDKEGDYSHQDPSSDEVEGSSWSIKDPLTELLSTSQTAWALTLQRKDSQECWSQHVANNSSVTVEAGACQ
jgi:hypothetical protein